MSESDIIRLIEQVLRQKLAPPQMGSIVSTEPKNRATTQFYANDAPKKNQRVIQPYGFASRPPAKMDTMIIPADFNATHLNVVGQYDPAAPVLDAEGESVLYGPDGQLIYMQSGGKILIGSKAASSPMVLGDVLQNFCDQLIGIISGAIGDIKTGPVAVTTTPGNPAPTHPALIAKLALRLSDLMSAQSEFVDTSSTNFLSKDNFTERGT